MKDCVVFGTSELAELVVYNLINEGKRPVALVVTDDYWETLQLKKKYELPIVSYSRFTEQYSPKQSEVYVCTGYQRMNQLRSEISQQCKKDGYELASYVHPDANVLTDCIGSGCLIFEGAIISPFVQVGDGNIFYAGSLTAHHTILGDYNFCAISSSVAGNVRIGERNFIGNHATVKDGIHIGDRNLIGAGAYLTANIADEKVVVPARSVILQDHSSMEYM